MAEVGTVPCPMGRCELVPLVPLPDEALAACIASKLPEEAAAAAARPGALSEEEEEAKAQATNARVLEMFAGGSASDMEPSG